jgi:hypothetical protein
MVASGPKPGTPVAVYLAEMARLEAASVHAFRHSKRELVAHGAPRALVRAAERAARDEIRHARMAAALTRRYGSTPAPHEMKTVPIRSLEAMAIENAVEGCVRETLGALIATWQAACAKDPVIRSALARIARASRGVGIPNRRMGEGSAGCRRNYTRGARAAASLAKPDRTIGRHDMGR